MTVSNDETKHQRFLTVKITSLELNMLLGHEALKQTGLLDDPRADVVVRFHENKLEGRHTTYDIYVDITVDLLMTAASMRDEEPPDLESL